MTFGSNDLLLFTEPFGPLIDLNEEWEEQGATAAELEFSAFRYRCEDRGYIPVATGRFGGIDKQVIRKGHEAIEAELEYKIPPLVGPGGWVMGLDHRIPNGTPLEAYRFTLNKVWEIMKREIRS